MTAGSLDACRSGIGTSHTRSHERHTYKERTMTAATRVRPIHFRIFSRMRTALISPSSAARIAKTGGRTGSSRPLRTRVEISPVAMLEAETPGETWILRAGADVDALRRIEAVLVDEHRAEPGQWLATPADRRTAGMRTVLNVDVDAGD